MNERTKFLFPLFFLLVICSCDLLRDSPFEVEAWTPGEDFRGDPAGIRISLLFSHECDKVSTEQAFSLTEDRKTLKGNFFWEGWRLVFVPASPLEPDRDYALTLGTGAQDTDGLSLENNFEVSFSTRRPGERFRLIRTWPEHEGILAESRGEFRLFFSGPVSPDSCRDNVSFSPSTPGSWRLEDNNTTACFVPREPWAAGSLYRVKVDTAFSAVSGYHLGTEYLTRFSTGTDREGPALIKALALGPENFEPAEPGSPREEKEEEIPLGESGIYVGSGYAAWETFTRLCLVFSEPVDLSGLKSLLFTEPNTAIVMESPPEFSDRAVFRFAEPVWGNSFLFRLAPGVKDRTGNESGEEYIFKINIRGPFSRPPALVGIRLPMAPGKSGDREYLSFSLEDTFANLPVKSGEGRYPFAEEISSWMELYFECAPSAEIDIFSVMELFRMESTNRALSFSLLSILPEDFTQASPREGWEHLRRLELRGVFTNTVNSGVVTFRIPPGLKDKRGNRSAVDFRLSLLK